eukprot:CAMPEP_0172488482 /NCGR_PEP_ID=MMETSP1066-20121228/18014_1 /TAXON_ID=671091 /ORGANISM="Coscinodiscus wailesii, Strain CCMP2513" /LENGTH=114 /DNA_ID=CAMNT_0013255717 /DNA_START=473 /DNA_END=817 /DNA_ORIENTATION=-
MPPLKGSGHTSILSNELRHSFSRLRRLVSEEGQRDKKKSRCSEHQYQYSKEKYQLALWTVTLAEKEINSLRRGIVELEASLDVIDDVGVEGNYNIIEPDDEGNESEDNLSKSSV